MKWSYYKLLIFLLLWTACGNDSTTQQATASTNEEENVIEEPLPTTPEGVVRLYQQYLDENKFEEAKRISTPKEQERLNMLAEIISGDLLDSTVVETIFIQLICQETGDVATCKGSYKEDGEVYEDEFRLTKINGQWMVDVTEEEIFMESEEVVKDNM